MGAHPDDPMPPAAIFVVANKIAAAVGNSDSMVIRREMFEAPTDYEPFWEAVAGYDMAFGDRKPDDVAGIDFFWLRDGSGWIIEVPLRSSSGEITDVHISLFVPTDGETGKVQIRNLRIP
jgi:hypothetical protein